MSNCILDICTKAAETDMFSVDVLRSRAFERLLFGSSSSLGSSMASQAGLAVAGRGLSTGAEAPSGSAPAGAVAAAAPSAGPAAGAAVLFSFDFFEKTGCISGEVKLSGDLTQPGTHHSTCTCNMIWDMKNSIPSMMLKYFKSKITLTALAPT